MANENAVGHWSGTRKSMHFCLMGKEYARKEGRR
jgi:hypothetical protein